MKRVPSPSRCTFCEQFATERHHICGRAHLGWLRAHLGWPTDSVEDTIPVCTYHHRKLTAVLGQVDSTLMLKADSVEERKRRARLACSTLLWALDTKDFA